MTLSARALCRRREVAVLKVSSRRAKVNHFSSGAGDVSALFCVNMRTMRILGVVRTDFATHASWRLDVADCARSPDGGCVAMAMSATAPDQPDWTEWYVCVYDCTADRWRETARFYIGDQLVVSPSVDFDPSSAAWRLSVLFGDDDDEDDDRCARLATIDSGGVVERRLSGVTGWEGGVSGITHSLDGSLLVIQLVSALWRSADALCVTLVACARSLDVVCRYEPAIVALRPGEQLTAARPVFNRCGDCFAVRTTGDDVSGDDVSGCDVSGDDVSGDVHVFRMPTTCRLQSQCRTAILRQLGSRRLPATALESLPLPRRLKNYLAFRPPGAAPIHRPFAVE